MSKLPLCGHGIKGFGCGNPIEHVDHLFRCADCKMPMHQACLVQHFGDGAEHEVDGHGRMRSNHKLPHAFGIETAWLVSEILKRDAEIERLSVLVNP